MKLSIIAIIIQVFFGTHAEYSVTSNNRKICLVHTLEPLEICEREIDILYVQRGSTHSFVSDHSCYFMATLDETDNQNYVEKEYISTDDGIDIVKDTRYIIPMRDSNSSYFIVIDMADIYTDSIIYDFVILSRPWGMGHFDIQPHGAKSLDAMLYKANNCQNRYSYDDVDIKYNSGTKQWTITPLGNALIAYYSAMKNPCGKGPHGSSPLSPIVFTKGGLGSDNDGWTNTAFNLPMQLIRDGYILIKTNAGNYGYLTLRGDYSSATVYSNSNWISCGLHNLSRRREEAGNGSGLPQYFYICLIFSLPSILLMCGIRLIYKRCKRNQGITREANQSLMI